MENSKDFMRKLLHKSNQTISFCERDIHPINLYLISEKSIWKNQVLELDFKSISNLIFTACVAYKNQFQN